MSVDQDMFLMAHYCHEFELAVAQARRDGYVNDPIYLSIGTEHIAATLYRNAPLTDFKLFAQHRCHSYFLCPTLHEPSGIEKHKSLARELCGLPTGCNKGMGGSASISNEHMFGHSGLLGDQVPIAVGYAHASRNPTVCVLGDAAAEEDYVLGALGFAATHKVPILFICEDNNLSILTEVSTRRSWDIASVAYTMGIRSASLGDVSFSDGRHVQRFFNDNKPTFLNVHCKRGCWHAGVGDEPLVSEFIDRYIDSLDTNNKKQVESNKAIVKSIWDTVKREKDEYNKLKNNHSGNNKTTFIV